MFGFIPTQTLSQYHYSNTPNVDVFVKISDLKGKAFGISRFGSGSHLMVSLLATSRHWNTETDIKYEVKGGLSDLVNGITDKSTDSFLW